ncbi:hypothetical protein Cantr_01104 [Candida viswanathii]|uniref:Uncharacterized protein n=1 Tax=Candida viswanathii TaxID=5486 RepID=A0A367YIL5_9ASCO|nr:hypothetical protein Cantr_01104 [Candida viswanathii]
MLTLPLDLIVYIADVGDLTIKDIFSLSQLNRLMREKLLHAYFWHIVYNIHLGYVYKAYGIEQVVAPGGHYKACRDYYWKYLQIEKEVLEFPEANDYDIQEYVKKYCFENDYLPALLSHLRQQEIKWRHDILHHAKSTEFSSSCFLAELVAVHTFRLGFDLLTHFFSASTPPSVTAYERFWFGLSLLQKKAYKLIGTREEMACTMRHRIQGIITDVNPLPIINSTYCFKDAAEYAEYVTRLIWLLFLVYEDHRADPKALDSGGGYYEWFNMLSVWSGHQAHHVLLATIILNVVQQELEKLDIKIANGEARPEITLAFSGAVVGGFCVQFLHDEPVMAPTTAMVRYFEQHLHTSGDPLIAPMQKIVLGVMNVARRSYAGQLDRRDAFLKYVDGNSFCDNWFELMCDFFFPSLSPLNDGEDYRENRALRINVERILDHQGSMYFPVFERLGLADGVKAMPRPRKCHEPEYAPSEYQGKLVLSLRSFLPSVVFETYYDVTSSTAEMYKVLAVDNQLEVLRPSSFDVMDDITPADILQFIDFIGLANLPRYNIRGVSFDDGNDPRFIIK